MTVRLPAAVLFDLDGTLVDSEPVWDDALRQLARELGGELSAVARAATVGTNVAVSVDIVHADVGRLDADPAASGRRLVELAGERFAAGLVWLPGARELVDAVRAAGVPVALVTNTPRPLVRVALGPLLDELFDASGLRGRRRQRQAAPGAVPDGGRAAGRRPGGHGGGGGLADRGRVRGRGRLPGAGGAGRAPGARLGAADLRRVARRRRCRRPGRPAAPRGLTPPPNADLDVTDVFRGVSESVRSRSALRGQSAAMACSTLSRDARRAGSQAASTPATAASSR